MSAIECHVLDSVAFQLVAALEQYDALAVQTIAAWPDLERYRAMSDQVEQLRMYSSSLPQVRVQWVELLIAHAELAHSLWRMQYGPTQAVQGRVGTVRDHHADCIAALRNRCLQVIAQNGRLRDA